MKAHTVIIKGQPMKCQICGENEFDSHNILLNTAGASFLGFDWANKEASCYICTNCGFIHWFHPDYMQ